MEELHFACKNQLPGLSVSGTLVKNGLKTILKFPLLCVKCGDGTLPVKRASK